MIKAFLFGGRGTLGLISDFFKPVIKNKELLKEYEEAHFESQVQNVRIGHFFASLIFIGFFAFDYLSTQEQVLFFRLSLSRLLVVLLVLIPFSILSFQHNVKKYLRPAIFLTYLIFGGFISYAVFLFDNDQSAFSGNYYALDLIILAVFIMLTIKLKDTLLLSFVLIAFYNLVWVHIISNNPDYARGTLNFKFFMDLNVWLFTVVLSGSLIWIYNQNLSKKNFVIQRDLNLQKIALKKANDVKNKFFNLLTHDLKTLIGNQASITTSLIEDYEAMTATEKKELIELLGGASSRTLKVFDELTLWVHAQTDKIQINPEPINLLNAINEIADQLKLELNSKGVNLINQVADDLLVYCDLNSLKTVLRNLLGNALKFSYAKQNIYINANYKGAMLEVVVVDEGMGMTNHVLDSLFVIDKTNSQLGTKGEKGTGLGLILTKELLELNKGEIWAESKEGQGAYMYFTLPKANSLKE